MKTQSTKNKWLKKTSKFCKLILTNWLKAIWLTFVFSRTCARCWDRKGQYDLVPALQRSGMLLLRERCKQRSSMNHKI